MIEHWQMQTEHSSLADSDRTYKEPWFPDSKWVTVPCCFADHPDFLLYKSCADSNAWPWFKLCVFCKLGLNNSGHLAAKENHQVFSQQ